MSKCFGCGIEIQFTNPLEKGYINEEIYNKRLQAGKSILCERCFRLKNYNEERKIEINEEDFLQLTKSVVTNNMLVCYVCDAFDLDGTFIDNINDIFPHNPILLIANKYDLFMRSNRPTKIKKYIQNILDEKGINVCGVSVTSAKEEKSGEKIYQTILNTVNELHLGKDIFLFGMSNVGKSTILNAMINTIDDESEEKENKVTVSSALSTTLSINKINVREITIFDTPGIINKKQVTYYLTKKSIDYISPKNFVKPVIFQLYQDQTLFINGFAQISYLKNESDNDLNVICYFSRNMYIHRTKYQNKDEFYKKHCDDLLIVPRKSERKNLGKLITYQFNVDETKEISFSGLGFVGFSGSGIVEIKTFENIKVTLRGNMI